ncbi:MULTISPECIES: L-fucose isomerase [Paenibacillus]|uniref:L-fucose isomerase n=1 Tax=Paenibacillus TaxID=44249 RepID=UPI000178A7A5|nr:MULTISPECIES: L-fucose isomerase [unclassified Paenibacillus]ACX66024.1 L-fucose isomerase [Paenibacillus sp. Y412MC10]MBY0161411.1 L-fucose isomerase [Cytobacillus firmus]QOT11750.1 L-fucose isomerase [Paenibacillus sp. JNUCC-32]
MHNQSNICNRLQNELPKIGIRPIVDGRRGGIRESLEDVTMDMAKRTARLLTERLRHSNGLPVECVIADTCIGGVAEAARTEEKFARENVGLTISVTPSWCYPTETMDTHPTRPKAIWGFNGTERPGAVYLAAALGAHNQKGLPAFSIYGRDVQDIGDTEITADVQEKLLQFAKAGLAVATMKGTSYLSMGTVSMGIAGCIVDENFFQRYLGMRNEYVDMTEFVRRIELEIYDHDEYERALAWIKQNCKPGTDVNPEHLKRSEEQKEQDWETVAKMALIARDLMVGNPKLAAMGYGEEALGRHALAAGFQGQRAWTDYFPTGDFMEAILNSSFDWNGLREPYIVATENDNLNGITMLFGHLLTNAAQVFADVRTYWSPDAVKRVTGYELEGIAANGVIHLINSGPAALDGTGRQSKDGKPAMKPFWDITQEEVQDCLDAVKWCPAIDFFRGGGFSTDFTTRGGMPATIARINMVAGVGPVLHIAEGITVELPEAVHDVLDQRSDPTWPTTWFVPNLTGEGLFKDVYTVMSNWGSNHAAMSYGHIGGDLITLASMLRIPVCMHNVPEERIFRPSAWTAFGGLEPVSADYRACASYGPLYK